MSSISETGENLCKLAGRTNSIGVKYTSSNRPVLISEATEKLPGESFDKFSDDIPNVQTTHSKFSDDILKLQTRHSKFSNDLLNVQTRPSKFRDDLLNVQTRPAKFRDRKADKKHIH